jgi:hypothetical protein
MRLDWLECDIEPDYVTRDGDRNHPIGVAIRTEPDGALDIFRVTEDALTPDGWLKCQVLADSGNPPLVRILAADPSHFGRLEEDANFWSFCPSNQPRLVDGERSRGKARKVRTVRLERPIVQWENAHYV